MTLMLFIFVKILKSIRLYLTNIIAKSIKILIKSWITATAKGETLYNENMYALIARPNPQNNPDNKPADTPILFLITFYILFQIF